LKAHRPIQLKTPVSDKMETIIIMLNSKVLHWDWKENFSSGLVVIGVLRNIRVLFIIWNYQIQQILFRTYFCIVVGLDIKIYKIVSICLPFTAAIHQATRLISCRNNFQNLQVILQRLQATKL
jgi:hypothetical protein